MQQVKNFTKILLLSFVTFFPLWHTSAIAADSPVEKVVSTININTASAQELSDGLNGVGIKRAEKIVQYREAHGDFSSVEQLIAVKGIGEKVLEKNKSHIVVK
jgi:competence protein ComEA